MAMAWETLPALRASWTTSAGSALMPSGSPPSILPMADFGYDISNYIDVHPLFGTLKDLDTLVQQAHQRDLKVILDFVPNHTSDEHPWFQEARSSRTNEKRDWYIWR